MAGFNGKEKTMSDNRPQRLGHQLRSEISEFIQRGLVKDPRVGFVSISSVRISKDLSYAKVFVSVFGSEQEGQSSIKALENASGFIRHHLGKRLHIRRIPELIFLQDTSIEEGVRITQLIDKALEPAENESRNDD
jgi:ribosome-binding factor A